MKPKTNLRDFLENPAAFNYLSFKVKQRGFKGDSDTLLEIQSAVVQRLLEREEYYEESFEHGIKTFINLVITEVFGKFSRKPDALNGDLVFLDAPSDDEDGGTIHDVICEQEQFNQGKKDLTFEKTKFGLFVYKQQSSFDKQFFEINYKKKDVERHEKNLAELEIQFEQCKDEFYKESYQILKVYKERLKNLKKREDNIREMEKKLSR